MEANQQSKNANNWKCIMYAKCSITMIMLVLFSFDGMTQNKKMAVGVQINLKVDTIKVKVYKPYSTIKKDSIKTVVLKMNYGGSEILNPDAAYELEKGGCNIISVDVVYTDFKDQFYQDRLNCKRITELYFMCPDVFSQSMTQWWYVKQTGCSNEASAQKLFHGIVIKYIKVPQYEPLTLSEMTNEIKKGRIDTSLFRVFDKNIKLKNEELICVDLTGSMSPYYFQFFVWLHLKKNTTPMNFSFFNDGDNKPDHLKKTGNVGGIYLVNTNSIDTMTKYAYTCIKNGFGGDTPENNIESIKKGLKKFPNSKEIVMIADNWSDMRDYGLISEVSLPVKVIICGTKYAGINSPINPQYLDLARKTRGSVLTIEEEISNLAQMKEGEMVTIGGSKFAIKGGKFIKL